MLSSDHIMGIAVHMIARYTARTRRRKPVRKRMARGLQREQRRQRGSSPPDSTSSARPPLVLRPLLLRVA